MQSKLKYAIKASLSVALAFIIAFSEGLNQATTAAITIILIASMGSMGDSLMKGWMRIVGTVVGATLGLILVSNFPQSREIYLIIASIVVTIALYLARAYKGDLAVFLLGTITFLFMFQGGNVENAFMYGVEKTFMTILGIIIYTLVGVLLWPVSIVDNSVNSAIDTTNLELELYKLKDSTKDEKSSAYQKLLDSEAKLSSAIVDITETSKDISFSKNEYYSIVHDYKNINKLLTLLIINSTDVYSTDISKYIKNFNDLNKEIETLFEDISLSWSRQNSINIPNQFNLIYNDEEIQKLTPLKQASIVTTTQYMQKLHALLSILANKINSILSPQPTSFKLIKSSNSSIFHWFDIEDLKGALVTFIIFWVSVLLWIEINPPGGFIIVILATALSVMTTFTPFKPSTLMILFSFGFIFATLMYVFVLPNLHYGWELGLFVFFYAFVGFYFINPKITPLFLLSIATLFLYNEMNYNFNFFILFLFIFYLFLSILLVLYYIPFSTKPEYIFLLLRERFFKFATQIVASSNTINQSYLNRLFTNYSKLHLMSTVKKMQLWASKIDTNYFTDIEKEELLNYTKELEIFAYILQIMSINTKKLEHNPISKNYFLKYTASSLYEILNSYTKEQMKIDKNIEHTIEERLKEFLPPLSSKKYTKDEIIKFYEHISIRKDVWMALLDVQKSEKGLNLESLKNTKF